MERKRTNKQLKLDPLRRDFFCLFFLMTLIYKFKKKRTFALIRTSPALHFARPSAEFICICLWTWCHPPAVMSSTLNPCLNEFLFYFFLFF